LKFCYLLKLVIKFLSCTDEWIEKQRAERNKSFAYSYDNDSSNVRREGGDKRASKRYFDTTSGSSSGGLENSSKRKNNANVEQSIMENLKFMSAKYGPKN
jgi:hypothetical protein